MTELSAFLHLKIKTKTVYKLNVLEIQGEKALLRVISLFLFGNLPEIAQRLSFTETYKVVLFIISIKNIPSSVADSGHVCRWLLSCGKLQTEPFYMKNWHNAHSIVFGYNMHCIYASISLYCNQV